MACAGKGRFGARAAPTVLALCAAALAGDGLAAATERSVSIELRSRVSVSQAQVRLGDIAFLTSNDLPLLRQLMALPIGAAPRLGTVQQLDRDSVASWVEARSGWPMIRWSGAEEAEVVSASQQLAGEAVVEAARASLVQWLSERSERAVAEPVSTARDLVLPAGAATLRVRPLAPQGMPARRMTVWVDIWVGDRFVRTAAVTFDVGAWAPVTVATADVDRRAAVDPIVIEGALAQREVDLTTLRGRIPVAAEAPRALGGSKATTKRLRRPLKTGDVLTQAHLETEPLVKRGSWADLTSRSGEVSIESRVEVLQDGRAGDRVLVKVPGGSGEVLALVTGAGRVEVQP